MEKIVEPEKTLEETRQSEKKWPRKMKMGSEEKEEQEQEQKEAEEQNGQEEEEEQQEEEAVFTTTPQFNLMRKLSQIEQNLTSLNLLQTSSEIHLLKLQDRLREQKAEVTRRKQLNESARKRLRNLILMNVTKPTDRLRLQEEPKLEKLQEGLNHRRSELMGDLSKIYPIEPMSDSHSNTSNTTSSNSSLLLFSIADVILPNLEPTTTITNTRNNQSRLVNSSSNKSTSLIHLFNYNINERRDDLADDDCIVSTALGFISHLITLVSSYLNVPLVYPICFFGSRSSVSDFVSRINGPRSFPLYFKGVDRFRFEYGVFLLNKNIEQIMYHQKIIVSDIRQTLPNLKNLFLTLEPNPTTLERRTSTKGPSRDQNNEIDSNEGSKNVDENHRSSSESVTNSRIRSNSKGSKNHKDDASKNDDDETNKLSSNLEDLALLSPHQLHLSKLPNQTSSSSDSPPPLPNPSITRPTNQNSSPLPLSSQSSFVSSDPHPINSFTLQHHHHQSEKSI